MIKGIAIVKSTANKSSYNSFGDSKTYTGEYDKGHKCDKSSNLQVYCLKFRLLSKVTPKFCAEIAGVKFWLSIGVGKKQ